MRRGSPSNRAGRGLASRRRAPGEWRSVGLPGRPRSRTGAGPGSRWHGGRWPASVRTCLSSPVCEAHMMASSEGVRERSSAAPDSMSATTPKGLTVERSMTSVLGAPTARDTLPAASTWTMWPRCRLSTALPRRTSTSTGGADPLRVREERLRDRGAAALAAVSSTSGSSPRSLGEAGRDGRSGTPRWYRGSARPVCGRSRRIGSSPPRMHPEAACARPAKPFRLEASRSAAQAGAAARRADRPQEVPRARSRDQLAGGLRSPRRRTAQ